MPQIWIQSPLYSNITKLFSWLRVYFFFSPIFFIGNMNPNYVLTIICVCSLEVVVWRGAGEYENILPLACTVLHTQGTKVKANWNCTALCLDKLTYSHILAKYSKHVPYFILYKLYKNLNCIYKNILHTVLKDSRLNVKLPALHWTFMAKTFVVTSPS